MGRNWKGGYGKKATEIPGFRVKPGMTNTGRGTIPDKPEWRIEDKANTLAVNIHLTVWIPN